MTPGNESQLKHVAEDIELKSFNTFRKGYQIRKRADTKMPESSRGLYQDHQFFSDDRSKLESNRQSIKYSNNLTFESTMIKNFPAAEISRNIYRHRKNRICGKNNILNKSIDYYVGQNQKIKYIDQFPQNTDISIDCGELSSFISIEKRPNNSILVASAQRSNESRSKNDPSCLEDTLVCVESQNQNDEQNKKVKSSEIYKDEITSQH